MRAPPGIVWQGTLALMVVAAACVGGQPGAGAQPARPLAIPATPAAPASAAPSPKVEFGATSLRSER